MASLENLLNALLGRLLRPAPVPVPIPVRVNEPHRRRR